MKSVLVYSSKYGFTEEIVKKIQSQVQGECALINLRQPNDVEKLVKESDMIVVGGPIYIGGLLKEVKQFLMHHQADLLQKRLGLFITGMHEHNEIEKELEINFSQELRDHAQFVVWVGGEFNFDKLKFMDKMIVKKIAKTDETKTVVMDDEINNIVNIINSTT